MADATIATQVHQALDVEAHFTAEVAFDAMSAVDDLANLGHFGFGDALLESAVEAGRAAGCVVIEGEALPGDRDLKNLYERAGITARLIIVSKPL